MDLETALLLTRKEKCRHSVGRWLPVG